MIQIKKRINTNLEICPMAGGRKKTQSSRIPVNSAKCGKCDDPVLTDDEEVDIDCTHCKKWYHAMCCNLSPAEYRKAT